METQICPLPVSAHREMEGLNKELMDSSCTSIWDKAPPSMLVLKLDISVSPWTSPAPFELLPQPCSSEEVSSSASKSACRLFKRNTWYSSLPLSHWATFSTNFQSQKLWGLESLLVEPAGTPHFSRGTSTVEIALFTFNCHAGVWDQPVSCLRLSYQSPGGLFCMTLVVGLLFI